MTISNNVNDRERDKFQDVGSIPHVSVVSPSYDSTSGTTLIKDYAYDPSTGSNEITNVSPALLQTMEVTMLSAVTADGASAAVNVSNYNKITFHVIASSVTHGGTMTLSHSLDETNYYDFSSTAISADGITEVIVENQKYKYVLAELSARTDGTYTTMMLSGN